MFELVKALISKGADPNIDDVAGMGALYAAVDMNSLQWVQGRPAPILTDRLDAVDLVRLLLAKGANPNARLKTRPLKRHHDAGSTLNFGEGTTPLMRAARTNDVAVMQLLLDAGADPFLTLPDRTNALMLAAGQGYGGLRGEGIRIVDFKLAKNIRFAGKRVNIGADVYNVFNSDAALGYCGTFPSPSQNIEGCGTAAAGTLSPWRTVNNITTPRYVRFQMQFDF